ncbi:hypothetical protein P5673_008726 [Acropora cervicornis]|uniref:Uncharacterized protein n=1 Tax=Acropora cervicornis TaxID=6130 RepID=A0AAD9QT76_ACRCE|nr:hypothetical protein P5673_008726 [Acropora cervicornis]
MLLFQEEKIAITKARIICILRAFWLRKNYVKTMYKINPCHIHIASTTIQLLLKLPRYLLFHDQDYQ